MRRKEADLLPRTGVVDEAAELEGFDTFDDFESSDPTPVGQMKLSKAPPEAAKPGTPRPELLERLGLPSGPTPQASGAEDEGGSSGRAASSAWLRARFSEVPSPAALMLTGLVVLTLAALLFTFGAMTSPSDPAAPATLSAD